MSYYRGSGARLITTVQPSTKMRQPLFSASTRETELARWYRDHSIVGVLLRKMTLADKNVEHEKYYQRDTAKLAGVQDSCRLNYLS